MKECPSVKPGASSLVGSVSGYPGGLNGSTQHHLEVRLQRFEQLKSFASVDSNGTLPCLVLIEYSRADRFSRGRESMSDQLIRWCCIDRLSLQRLPEK
jgi:hypothetical protein